MSVQTSKGGSTQTDWGKEKCGVTQPPKETQENELLEKHKWRRWQNGCDRWQAQDGDSNPVDVDEDSNRRHWDELDDGIEWGLVEIVRTKLGLRGQKYAGIIIERVSWCPGTYLVNVLCPRTNTLSLIPGALL